jgi:hypothetical protein
MDNAVRCFNSPAEGSKESFAFQQMVTDSIKIAFPGIAQTD